ncbi:MAG: class I SAM-dependent methyltransferase, partial [Nocardioidaceae bacterium]
AQEYADFRPGYPDDAVEWLVGHAPAQVLELGAGTGKLTERMVALGHDVMATDPSEQMLDQLGRIVPRARRTACPAEDLPMANASFDVVVAAQAFHWFDHERALPEIARVLRPGGVLALVWNNADQKVPWVRKVFSLIEAAADAEVRATTAAPGETDVGRDPVAGSELFAPSADRVVRHWQSMDRKALLGFCSSHSAVATLSDDRRHELLEQVGAIYDSYGRGPDGMLLPWNANCYRARVAAQSESRGGAGDQLLDRPIDPFHPGGPHQRSGEDPVDEDDLDDGLLVDFR